MMDGSVGMVECEVDKRTFHFRPFHKEQQFLNNGAYGDVCMAVDERNGDRVAVKKLYQPFFDGDRARRAFRELRLLRKLQHENLLSLIDVYTPDKSPQQLENIYLVTEHAGHDLSSVIKTIPYQAAHIQEIIYQLLCGLKYLHSADIVHRDLKPSNLGLTHECDLTILDFGLARKVSFDIMTEYVMTRFYRAPEIYIWNGKYDHRADMWSVGCIMAELFTKKILFRGDSTPQQYVLIVKLCGSPSEQLLDRIESESSEMTRKGLESVCRTKEERKDFHQVFPNIPADALDFLSKILVLDPQERMSVFEALEHPYLLPYKECNETENDINVNIELDDTTVSTHDLLGWKAKIWKEICDCQIEFREQESNSPVAICPVQNGFSVDSTGSSTSNCQSSID